MKGLLNSWKLSGSVNAILDRKTLFINAIVNVSANPIGGYANKEWNLGFMI